MATADKILLGKGTVSIDGTPIGLTRGGSSFVVEREVRQIEADGDMGPVKGRNAIDKEVGKLKINALEIFTAADMVNYFPATALVSGVTYDEWRSTLLFLTTDYHTVTFTGSTKDGKAVIVEVENAINLGNLELTFEDKNEVVPALEYTANYLESAITTPPWVIKFGKGTSYSVAITVTSNGTDEIVGATVEMYGIQAVSDVSGVATFANIPAGVHSFEASAGGYQTYFGTITVSGAFTDTITMVAIA
jgi:hypothetical protein